jgi:hypothetical protein
MQRRNFITGASALSLASLYPLSSHAQTTCVPTVTPTGIDVVAEIKALRIPTGPYAGGYEIAPNGRQNWYFNQLGLLPIVQFLSPADLETYIRSYLDLYLRCITPACTIDDIDMPFGRANTSACVKVASDSDDSYAATFLSLAVRYVRASGNWAWWESNKARLKEIAYRNLAVPAKVSGLTSVFQAPRNQTNSIGYLMDNCEGYRGLRDFASMLRQRGELIEANYYDLLAANAAGGIVARLYSSSRAAFLPSDAATNPETDFYPGTTCQVFPQAFGLVELTPLFDAGWKYLNTHSPGWEDGRHNPFAWAVLGFVAAKRGLHTQARAQLASVEKAFASNRALVTINELGFYRRTQSVLAGGVDV